MGLLSGALACTEPDHSRLPRRVIDKAAAYGDASLVPTRQGERARHEVALAGEIERLVAVDSRVQRVEATVRLSPSTAAPHVAVVVQHRGRALDDETHRDLAAELVALAQSVVPAAAIDDIDIVIHRDSPPSTPSLPWALAVALLGLGISTGVAVERWRRRIRDATARPRPS